MTASLTALVLVLAALPTPPHKVVFPTRKGDVTLDHAAHLARRTPCKACHGPGVVGKLEDWEYQRAHLVCVGCHRDGGRGPIVCSGCHAPQPDPQPQAATAPAGGANETAPDP